MAERRRRVPSEERAAQSRKICAALQAHVPPRGTIAAYLATDDELDIDEFIRALQPAATIAVPRWDAARRTYILARLGDADPASLHPGHYGIREPEAAADGEDEIPPGAVDCWILPGLAFTREGARLGYGGGWYDRFLARARADARVLAVAYPFQILDEVPCDRHDAKADEIIS